MLAQEENAGFESLDGLLKKFNKKLKETPVPGRSSYDNAACMSMIFCAMIYRMYSGRVLNMECNSMLYSMSDFSTGSFRNLVEPDKSFWANQTSTGRAVFMQFIRLFYVVGAPEPVEVGLQDFAPDLVEPGTQWKEPVFQTQNDCLDKANQWIASSGVH